MKFILILMVFVFVVCSFCPTFSYANSRLIKDSLEDMAWINIGKQGYVKHNKDKWSGPKDLYFRYKIKEAKGVLYLWVDVTDDKVFMKDGDTIVSDHVEIWLADPRLSDIHKNSIAKLQKMIKKLNDVLANKDVDVQNLRESVIFTLNQMKSLKNMYANNKYYTQFIFNKKIVFILSFKNYF